MKRNTSHQLACTVMACSPYSKQPGRWRPRAMRGAALALSPDKEAARAMATRLFPAIDLLRKADHNRAEALLLAHYGVTRHENRC
ncbi:hypothetical protein [Thiomonas sp.]